jgi:hypothetical protein
MAGSGPVKSPSPSYHLTGDRQANGAARMHPDEELITVAEVQSFADLGWKNQSTASSSARLGRLLLPNANHE